MFLNERPLAGSAGWYWQTDSRYRLNHLFGACAGRSALGCRPWDLPGIDIHHPDWAVQFEALMARRPFENLLCRRIDAMGRLRHCRVSGEPMFGPKGRFLGFRGVGHDAGQAIEAERALVQDLGDTLATVLAQAGQARAQLPEASPAHACLDEIDQAGRRAHVMCRLIHELLVPMTAVTTAPQGGTLS